MNRRIRPWLFLGLAVIGAGVFYWFNGGNPSMAQIAIPKEILKKADDELYRTKKSFRGKEHDRYYFKGWTTYDHPVRPVGSLSYPQTQDPSYEGSYDEVIIDPSRELPLFVFMETFLVHRTPFVLPDSTRVSGAGEHYFAVLRSGEKTLIEKEVGIKGTVDLPEYLRVAVDDRGQIAVSEIVKKSPDGSTEYFYNERGLLRKVLMIKPDRSQSVLDYSYDTQGRLMPIKSTLIDPQGKVIRQD